MLKIWVLLSSCLQLLSRAGEGQASPPRANSRSEEPDDNTSCLRIRCPKRTSSVGVTFGIKKTQHFSEWKVFQEKHSFLPLACRTVVLWSVNRSWASRLGIFLTTVGTMRSWAPDDKARNISTTEGSKVRGEARKTTSSALIWNRDLSRANQMCQISQFKITL